MLSIPINKDPFAYRRKVVFGLTDRMLGYSAAALASGVAMGAYLTWVLAVPPSSLLGQVLRQGKPHLARAHNNNVQAASTLSITALQAFGHCLRAFFFLS